MEENKNKDAIGALWIKENQYGQYFTGNIELNGQKINVVVFSNKKTAEKQPDYRILISKGSAPAPSVLNEPAPPPIDSAPGLPDDFGLTPGDYQV